MKTFLPVVSQKAASYGEQEHGELDRLLGSLQAVHSRQVSPGLEARVLARLEAHSEANAAGGGLRAIYRVALSGAWAPTLAAASLFCVFTGGFLVAREASLATRALPAAVLTPYASEAGAGMVGASRAVYAAPGPLGLDTASARRKPAAPVPAGRRRGRATASTRAASASTGVR